MKKVKLDMSSFSLSSLPREIVTHVASFMEPLDLYMCKQTCIYFSDIDRGHALRDPTLSMVGTQYKLYSLCSHCQKKIEDKYVTESGMMLHKRCQGMMHRYVRRFVREGEKWVKITGSKSPIGLFKTFYEQWYPSLWDFHEYVETCKYNVDLEEVIKFFNINSMKSFVEKNYNRCMVLGDVKINVFDAYMKNGGEWGKNALDTIAHMDEFADDMLRRYISAEELFRDHSRVRDSRFQEFYQDYYANIFKEIIIDEFVKAVKRYDLKVIQRMLIRLSRKCLCDHLMECDCRWCCEFYSYLNMGGFVKLLEYLPYSGGEESFVGRIYDEGVETTIATVIANLELILNCSRGLVHNDHSFSEKCRDHVHKINYIDAYISNRLGFHEDMWFRRNSPEIVQHDLKEFIIHFVVNY